MEPEQEREKAELMEELWQGPWKVAGVAAILVWVVILVVVGAIVFLLTLPLHLFSVVQTAWNKLFRI